jgi:hypothetical protein
LVKPVTVYVVASDPVFAMIVVHVDPFVDVSTRHPVTVAPEVHVIASSPSPGVTASPAGALT